MKIKCNLEIPVFWYVMTCRWTSSFRRFEGYSAFIFRAKLFYKYMWVYYTL